MTRWHWVRHGPTHQKSFVGWRDSPADLSDISALKRLSEHLPETALLVSSDLARSVATADKLQCPVRRRLPHQPGLREIHFGQWDGLHFTTISDRDPALSRAFWDNPGDVRAPGGESWDIAATRVHAVVRMLNARYPAANIVAVAHFGTILTQVQRALGVSAYDVLSHKIDNFSVTTIDWHGETGTVRAINHAA